MRNKVFLVIFFGYIGISLLLTHWQPDKTLSVRENRPLHQFPLVKSSAFISGEFQDRWEKALADRLYGIDRMKQVFNGWKQKSLGLTLGIFSLGMQKLEMENTDFEAIYLPRGENIFEIKGSGNLMLFVYEPETALPMMEEAIKRIRREVNRCRQFNTETEFYLYYIEGNRDIDFKNRQFPHLYQSLLQKEFEEIGKFGSFSIDRLSDFTEQFYQTDHHWNHLGQAHAYRDLVNLLIGEGNARPLTSQQIGGIRFVGSRARQIDDFTRGDAFYVNIAAIGEHDTYVNGIKTSHGNLQAYIEGKANPDIEISHYSECYGTDKGLIEYDFHRPEKQNLLIIADSYSNPLNSLLASHFNRSFVVDVRHYQEDRQESFDLLRFVSEKEIDKVLFLGSAGMFLSERFLPDLAETREVK